MTAPLSFRILGPLEVARDGEPVRIGGLKARLLLAVLLLNPGRVVAVDTLVDALWGEDHLPERAAATLHVHVCNVRKVFADALPAIITQPPGYVIHATGADLDLLRFEELVQQAADDRAAGAPDRAATALATALRLWRGPALADIEGSPTVDAARAWLDERRLGAVEDWANALLALGDARRAVDELAPYVRQHPLRENLWEPFILGLYRCGRQADAFTAYGHARRSLRVELGIEPGVRLRTLEAAMLHQDPGLDLVPPRPAGPAGAARGAVAPAAMADVTAKVAALPQGYLVLADGSTLPLVDRVTIGRQPGCDVTLPDPSVSRQHAEIRATVGGFLLLDLSSSNDTRVGGRQVMQQLLVDGDEIEIGATVLTFSSADGELSAP